MFHTVKVLIILSLMIFLINTKVTLSFSVSINISSHDIDNLGMPNDISMTLYKSSNISTNLHLTLVTHNTGDTPIYTVNIGQNGTKEVNKVNISLNKNVAFYQDLQNEAVVQLTKREFSSGKRNNFIIKRGEYTENNVRYSIQPLMRSKRGATLNDNQSDQLYDVEPVSIPTTGKMDYIPTPPEQPTLKTIQYPNERKFPDRTKNKRRKRQSVSTYYIDVTAFLDYSCYSRFLSQAFHDVDKAMKSIREYYAFIFNGIDLIYQNFKAKNIQLRVRLSKVVVFETTLAFEIFYFTTLDRMTSSYAIKVNTDLVLANFKLFLNSSTGRDLSFPYDHAMLFLGTDMYRTNGDDILGLAYIKTLCTTDGSSASVVEDTGDFSAILSGAHELGHSLSAEHDETNNTCLFSDHYLMAFAVSDGVRGKELHPWRFSNCTVDYFVSYITSLLDTASGQSCLSDTLPVVGEFPDISTRLLGQEYPPKQQCQLRYGYMSYICNSPSISSNICSVLYCYNPSSILYCFSQPALSGTTCGCGKICRQGECVFDLLAPAGDCDIWDNCTTTFCMDERLRVRCNKTCSIQYNTSRISAATPTTSTATIRLNTATSSTLIIPRTSTTSATTVSEDSIRWTTKSSTKEKYLVPTVYCQDDPDFTLHGLNCRAVVRESDNMCYKRSVQGSCCLSCRRFLTNITGCEFGDRDKLKCASISSCQGHTDVCCHTCHGRSMSLSVNNSFIVTVLAQVMVQSVLFVVYTLTT